MSDMAEVLRWQNYVKIRDERIAELEAENTVLSMRYGFLSLEKEQDKKNLTTLHDEVEAHIRAWSERTGKKKVAPFPADAPCYYCHFDPLNPSYRDMGFKPCEYCIHNPEAKIYK